MHPRGEVYRTRARKRHSVTAGAGGGAGRRRRAAHGHRREGGRAAPRLLGGNARVVETGGFCYPPQDGASGKGSDEGHRGPRGKKGGGKKIPNRVVGKAEKSEKGQTLP